MTTAQNLLEALYGAKTQFLVTELSDPPPAEDVVTYDIIVLDGLPHLPDGYPSSKVLRVNDNKLIKWESLLQDKSRVAVVQKSVTDAEDCHAILSAANSCLAKGGGSSGAIWDETAFMREQLSASSAHDLRNRKRALVKHELDTDTYPTDTVVDYQSELEGCWRQGQTDTEESKARSILFPGESILFSNVGLGDATSRWKHVIQSMGPDFSTSQNEDNHERDLRNAWRTAFMCFEDSLGDIEVGNDWFGVLPLSGGIFSNGETDRVYRIMLEEIEKALMQYPSLKVKIFLMKEQEFEEVGRLLEDA